MSNIDYSNGSLYIANSNVYDDYGRVAEIKSSYLVFNPDRGISKDYMIIVNKFVDEAVKAGYKR